jgi:hypothetical protein
MLNYIPYPGQHGSFEKRTQFSCPQCSQNFKPSKLYQICCSEKCEKIKNDIMHSIQEKQLNTHCADCGLKVRKQGNSGPRFNLCRSCYLHKMKIKRKNISEKVEKPKHKKQKIDYDSLIKQSEYKRVMSDKGWSHYLKGRKWDRI